MIDFLKAALPWIAISFVIIAFCVQHNKKTKQKKHSNEEHNEKEDCDTYMTEGMCIGMFVGVVIGRVIEYDNATALTVGAALGLAIGSFFKKPTQK